MLRNLMYFQFRVDVTIVTDVERLYTLTHSEPTVFLMLPSDWLLSLFTLV